MRVVFYTKNSKKYTEKSAEKNYAILLWEGKFDGIVLENFYRLIGATLIGNFFDYPFLK